MALYTQMVTVFGDPDDVTGTNTIDLQFGMEVTHYGQGAQTLYPGSKIPIFSVRVLPNAQIAWGWLQRSIGKVDLSGLFRCNSLGSSSVTTQLLNARAYFGFYAVDSTGTVSPCVWTIPLENASNYTGVSGFADHTNMPADKKWDEKARMPLINQPVQDNGYLLMTLEIPKDLGGNVSLNNTLDAAISAVYAPITISTELS